MDLSLVTQKLHAIMLLDFLSILVFFMAISIIIIKGE